MQQLFLNLLSNSLKFRNPEIPPIIGIVGAQTSGPGSDIDDGDNRYYQISVSDNGIGFDQKYVDRIFQPFQRLHPFEKFEGTGMGLAICRKIVERHDGTITAHGQPGEGATFIITIPLDQKEGFER